MSPKEQGLYKKEKLFMNINTFIHRPLFSMVISVIIVLLGVISLLSLPVERYPDIAPPAIYVWASYPGASAETVQKSVVMPLEEAINGVEGMTYMTSSASNGSASITIYFEQGANADMAAVNVQNRVIQAQAQLPAEIEKTLPKDIKFVTFDNTNDFLFASIREVILTLIIAIVLVLVVVLFFLHDFRATLIPAVGIIVSLIGTFAFMNVAGFSVNLLTLFALVLVIGTVVDDSIVVVEAVKARFDEGYTSARKASEDAMSGLSVSLFTTTLVFMVIFIPVAFMGGTTGIFFKQFGLTMAVAVGISLINTLTLSPALCALMLRPDTTDDKGVMHYLRKAYNITFSSLLKHYSNLVSRLLNRKVWVTCSVAVSLLLFGILFKIVPTGFIPNEDMGTLFVDITAPSGYTAHKTVNLMNRVCDNIRELPEVQDVGGVVGVGSGGNGGFEFSVQGRNGQDARTLHGVTTRFIEKLSERPEIGEVYSSYEVNYPQYRVDLDVARCKNMGVAPSTVLNEMGAYLGGDYISNFNKYNKVYQVDLQLRPSDRNRPESLAKLFVRSEGGVMMPINQFVTLTKEYMPQSLNSFNMFRSIDVSGSVAQGGSSGSAIRAIQETAAKELPVGYSLEFGGITREESQTSNRVIFIFMICIVFVYLLMVALYESLLIPLVVILSVPFGLAGSLLFAKLFGVENNIYMQIGMVMLVGLLSKTAILLTEYASQARKEGMSLTEAALSSAKVRLRPILMTSLTMIIGMLPLMFASGVGANGSRTIGVCVVGGMLFGTLGLLLSVPVLFVVFQKKSLS